MALSESEELELLELEDQEATSQQAAPKSSDLASTLYHGAIEGGAMTLGGAAGAILGAPAGPVGSAAAGVGLAAAMYPPAKRFAEGIDQMRGLTPPPPQNPAKEFGQGLEIEAGGKVMGPALRVAGKILPGAKVGEMLSGTPANNLKRAYKQGFTETYLKPKRLAEAGEAFGDEKFKMVGQTLTPEEQVGMMVNPRGEANAKVADVMTRWIKGEKIGADEALAARQGIDTIFPADTAAKQVQRGGLSQFRDALNKIIGEQNPAFKSASDEYAKSKLRSHLLKPFRVNRSNPEQYSKLSGILAALTGVGSAAGKSALPIMGYALGTSPLAMGLTSSVAGSIAKTSVPEPVRRAALAAFISKVTTNQGTKETH